MTLQDTIKLIKNKNIDINKKIKELKKLNIDYNELDNVDKPLYLYFIKDDKLFDFILTTNANFEYCNNNKNIIDIMLLKNRHENLLKLLKHKNILNNKRNGLDSIYDYIIGPFHKMERCALSSGRKLIINDNKTLIDICKHIILNLPNSHLSTPKDIYNLVELDILFYRNNENINELILNDSLFYDLLENREELFILDIYYVPLFREFTNLLSCVMNIYFNKFKKYPIQLILDLINKNNNILNVSNKSSTNDILIFVHELLRYADDEIIIDFFKILENKKFNFDIPINSGSNNYGDNIYNLLFFCYILDRFKIFEYLSKLVNPLTTLSGNKNLFVHILLNTQKDKDKNKYFNLIKNKCFNIYFKESKDGEVLTLQKFTKHKLKEFPTFNLEFLNKTISCNKYNNFYPNEYNHFVFLLFMSKKYNTYMPIKLLKNKQLLFYDYIQKKILYSFKNIPNKGTHNNYLNYEHIINLKLLDKIKKSKKIGLIPLVIIFIDSSSHLSIIIVKDKNCYFFAPEGNSQYTAFDNYIHKTLYDYFLTFGYTYHYNKNLYFNGLQAIEKENMIFDPHGYCLAYSYFLAEFFLNNIELIENNYEIAHLALINQLYKNNIDIKQMIRCYASQFILLKEINDVILNEENIKKINNLVNEQVNKMLN